MAINLSRAARGPGTVIVDRTAEPVRDGPEPQLAPKGGGTALGNERHRTPLVPHLSGPLHRVCDERGPDAGAAPVGHDVAQSRYTHRSGAPNGQATRSPWREGRSLPPLDRLLPRLAEDRDAARWSVLCCLIYSIRRRSRQDTRCSKKRLRRTGDTSLTDAIDDTDETDDADEDATGTA